MFKNVRIRSINSILSEIRDIISMQSYNYINFYVNINIDKDFFKEFCNMFIDNNIEGISQAKDDGTNNNFEHNFWNDHTGPDSNKDGIVDTPYSIEGRANNVDSSPRAKPANTSSILTIPINIIFGVIFLVFISTILTIFLRKNRK